VTEDSFNPFDATVAPLSIFPFSSFTVPVILRVCDNSSAGINKNNVKDIHNFILIQQSFVKIE
jgi:hypothetical protein